MPCPTLLPELARPLPPLAGPFANSPGAHQFISRGFGGFSDEVIGNITFPADSSEAAVPGTAEGHLVIEGAPTGSDLRHLLYGPAADKYDHIVIVGRTRVHGLPGEFVRVFPGNSDSVFSNHVVLTWASGGHLYAVGFHGTTEAIEALDLAEASSMVLVPPKR